MIKRFFECLVPVTICNLKCEYCYIIQANRRKGEKACFRYTPEQIGKAMSQERLGGICYFSICGAGETFLAQEVPEIARELLKCGHYVNITTNGTISKAFDLLTELPSSLRGHLHLAFSFHYLELEKRSMTKIFFENVEKCRRAGISTIVQINLYDGYLPHLEEMRRLVREHCNAEPQLAATRDELAPEIRLMTALSFDEYRNAGACCDSPLFDFTLRNFMRRRTEFCYAGDWSGVLNLATGIFQKCYASNMKQNIFEYPDKPIRFEAVGNCCGSPYCVNSSHFISLGVIPELEAPTYAELRDRPGAAATGWYMPEMRTFLNDKLFKNNREYSALRKGWTNFHNICFYYAHAAGVKARRLLKMKPKMN